MKTADLSELAMRNLREALLRNSLTTLGVAVGVASLVAMLSIGVGLQQFAQRRLANTGLFNRVWVASRAELRDFERARQDRSLTVYRPPRRLDDSVRQEIAQLPNVDEVYPQVRFVTEVRYANVPHAAMVAGLPFSVRSDGAFADVKGAFFSGAAAEEAILQIDFAKELSSDPSSLLGKGLVLRYAQREALAAKPGASGPPVARADADSVDPGFAVVPREKKLTIVGIVETEPEGGFGGFRARIYIPLELAENLGATQVNDLRDVVRGSSGNRTYPSLMVRVSRTSQVESVESAIKNMGFTTFSLLDTTRDLRLFFTVIDLLLGIFGSLALAVATLGIVNTLIMAILERRREIGVFKALGADDRDVQQLFFAEAGAMGLIGGIFGVLLGWLIGRGVNWGTNIYLARRSLPAVNISAIPIWLAAGAIAFAVAVSLAAGVYPASRAARLNPVEALRYE